MDKSSLGVHQIKLVVKSSPGLSNSCSIGQHADSSLHLCQVSAGDGSRRLIVDSNFEPCGTPIHKLNAPLGLNCGNSSVDIFGYHVSSVQHAACHILPMPRITLDHRIGRFKACIGNLSYRQALMISFLSRDNRSIGYQREVDSWIWNQVSLKLIQINIQGSIKPKRSSDGGYDLTDQPVQVGVGGTFNIKVTSADIIDSFIIYHEGTVRVLQGSVSTQGGVVRFNNCSRNLNRKILNIISSTIKSHQGLSIRLMSEGQR